MRGIWRVTLNGRFYGDYREKRHALDAIDDARRTQESEGRRVSVVIDDDGAVA